MYSRFLEVVTPPGGQGSAVYVTSLAYPSGHVMWRARRLERVSTLPIQGMNRESDLWEAPANRVRHRGRLNAVGESVLYCSVGDAVVAMVEARVPSGACFALIRYETTRNVTLTSIASDSIPDGLPDDLREAHRAVVAFGRDIFTKEFDGHDQLTYVLSNRLAKDSFDLPEQLVDGWSFPSVARGRGVNAALRPAKAHDALRVSGVVCCTAIDSALLGPQIQGHLFSPGPEEGHADFRWSQMGSVVQDKLFPEFRA